LEVEAGVVEAEDVEGLLHADEEHVPSKLVSQLVCPKDTSCP